MLNRFALLLTLAIFSGLSMNLILRFGFGLQRISLEGNSGHSPNISKWAFFLWLCIFFISIIMLWLFFSLVQSVLFLGFFEYFLIFPVSYLFFSFLADLARRLFFGKNSGESVSLDDFCLTANGAFSSGASSNGVFSSGAMVSTAVFIILGLAGSFADAVVLSLGFSAGIAFAVLIAGEIQRRSGMEAVPRFLRGGPLVLITMGLLSLVFTSAAMMFFNVLGAE